jgi:hypothetical protein
MKAGFLLKGVLMSNSFLIPIPGTGIYDTKTIDDHQTETHTSPIFEN